MDTCLQFRNKIALSIGSVNIAGRELLIQNPQSVSGQSSYTFLLKDKRVIFRPIAQLMHMPLLQREMRDTDSPTRYSFGKLSPSEVTRVTSLIALLMARTRRPWIS